MKHSISKRIGLEIRCLLAAAAVGFAFANAHALPGELDPSFNPPSGVGTTVVTTVVQSDGKIVVGYQSGNVVRYLPDGSVDSSFTTSLTGSVRSVSLTSDNKYLVAGVFTVGSTSSYLLRLNSDGSVDTGFPSNIFDDEVYNTTELLNGQYIVGGKFTTVNSSSCVALARINKDGSYDSAFSANILGGQVYDVERLSDGNVVAAGNFHTNIVPNPILYATAKFDHSGNVTARGPITSAYAWPTHPHWSSGIIKIKELKDGGIMTLTSNGSLELLDSSLSVDTSFSVSFYNSYTVNTFAYDFCEQEDGNLLVGGFFNYVNGDTQNFIARLLPSGARGPFFDYYVNSWITNIALQEDGKLIVAGNFGYVQSTARPGLARLDNGPATSSLSISGVGATKTLTWTRGGTAPAVRSARFESSVDGGANWTILGQGVLSGSNWTFVGSIPTFGAVRAVGVSSSKSSDDVSDSIEELDYSPYTAAQLDASFNPNANRAVRTMVEQPDGKLVIGGTFITMGGASHGRAVRLLPDNTIDPAFAASVTWPGASDVASVYVGSLVVQPDGKILVGGNFTRIDNVVQSRFGRLNSDGTRDTGFAPAVGNGPVTAVCLQPDGKIVIAGDFTTVNGVARTRIARVYSDGTLDTSFAPVVNGVMQAMVLQPDGKIVIGGNFSQVNSVSRTRIARLNSDGTLDTGFTTTADGYVHTLALQADGKIVMGGNFTEVNSVTKTRIARLTTAGVLDSTFSALASANNEVYAFAIQTDGKIIVSGEFSLLNGVAVGRSGRLNSDGTRDTSFDANTSAIVYGTTVRKDGRVVIGGTFTSVQSTTRNRVAQLHNDPIFQKLTVSSPSRIEWLRGGASPEASRVTFEVSTDGGTTWSSLGAGTRISGGWELTGLSLTTGKIRARAYIPGGENGASSGLTETQKQF